MEFEFVACLFRIKCILFRARELSFCVNANLVLTLCAAHGLRTMCVLVLRISITHKRPRATNNGGGVTAKIRRSIYIYIYI